MPAELLSFFRPAASVRGDWSIQEVAEFYRVEAALVQAGISILVDRGVSDEGDPWFVFCRAGDGEVIVHFARIAGQYLIAAESIGRTLRGSDFRRLLSEFVSLNPTLIPMPSARGAKLLLHPASLLAAVVATALFHMSSTEAVANTVNPSAVQEAPVSIAGEMNREAGEIDRKWYDRQAAAVAVAMIALAAADFSQFGHGHFSSILSMASEGSSDNAPSSHSILSKVAPPIADELNTKDGTLLNFAGTSNWLEDGLSSQLVASATFGTISPPPATPKPAGLAEEKPSARSIFNDATVDNWHSDIDVPPAAAVSEGENRLIVSNRETKTVENITQKLVPGSSAPEHVVSLGTDQSAASVITNELFSLNRTVVYINLPNSLSVHDIIVHAANEVLGNSPASMFSASSISDSSTLLFQSEARLSSELEILPVVASTPSEPSSPYPLFGEEATATLSVFVRLNNFEIVTSDRNIVLFDTNAADFASPDLVIRTWAMNDGSTISIVGIMPHDFHV